MVTSATIAKRNLWLLTMLNTKENASTLMSVVKGIVQLSIFVTYPKYQSGNKNPKKNKAAQTKFCLEIIYSLFPKIKVFMMNISSGRDVG
jgi:heme/copper-type cytochrome/quinol oxidase subunit 2